MSLELIARGFAPQARGIGRAYDCVKLGRAEGGEATDLQYLMAGGGCHVEATGILLVKEGSGRAQREDDKLRRA